MKTEREALLSALKQQEDELGWYQRGNARRCRYRFVRDCTRNGMSEIDALRGLAAYRRVR